MWWHQAGAAGGSCFLVMDFLFGETGSIYHNSLYTIIHDKLATVVLSQALILVHLQIKAKYKDKCSHGSCQRGEGFFVVYKVGCTDRINPWLINILLISYMTLSFVPWSFCLDVFRNFNFIQITVLFGSFWVSCLLMNSCTSLVPLLTLTCLSKHNIGSHC